MAIIKERVAPSKSLFAPTPLQNVAWLTRIAGALGILQEAEERVN